MGKGGDSMTNKKDLIIAVLATFCLTATLLLAMPTRSQTPTGTYDPVIDNNHDGSINILDSIILANHFLTSGDPTVPVNVTNWPSPNYTLAQGMLNMSFNHGSVTGYYIPFVYCGGYSRLSLMILPTNASLGIGNSITIWLYNLQWFSNDTSPLCYSNEQVNSNIMNATIFNGGSFSASGLGCFITETKGPYCILAFNFIGSNLPASWWVTFNYSIYLRNE
jgi:hypothetical protein